MNYRALVLLLAIAYIYYVVYDYLLWNGYF